MCLWFYGGVYSEVVMTKLSNDALEAAAVTAERWPREASCLHNWFSNLQDHQTPEFNASLPINGQDAARFLEYG